MQEIKKLNERLPLIILIVCIISIFLVNFTYLSIILSIISLIFCFIFSKKNIRIFIITVIISIATIITDVIILSKESVDDVDIFKNKNILLGTWNYNTDGGTYIFKDDYTYTKYRNSNTLDNYCVGNYEYSYGGISKNNTVIKQDENNYYYNLLLTENYCINYNMKKDDVKEIKMVFGVNKNNYEDLIFMDTQNNYAFKVNKIK